MNMITTTEEDNMTVAEKVERGEEMMLIDEVAEYLGIPKRMVYHYVQNGRLKSIKPGKSRRLMRGDVDDFKRQLDGKDGGVREIPDGAMSTNEMAEWLRYHPEHIRRLVRTEGMPVHYAGIAGNLYFWKDEVLDWMRVRSNR